MSYTRLKIQICVVLIVGFLGLTDSESVQLFQDGKEYKYQYQGLFTTGTEEPSSHASTYRLHGTLRVQPTSENTLSAKLEDMKIAMYNGPWQYFPTPQFDFIEDERLATLQEPFKIELTDEGKFKSLTMNDQEPEFASNMKRGLATYFQLNLTGGYDNVKIFKELELTTLGECPTNYEITPAGTSSVRVAKFRNHADCPDIPKRTRHGNRAFYACNSDHTRDIMNSTSYAVYDLRLDDKQNPTIDKITVLSSILYWPFTSSGQFLYTWYNLTLALESVSPSPASKIPAPENAENHEDLAFVFEQSDYQDPEEETPDLKTVEPFYFHQTLADTEPETMTALVEKVKEALDSAVERINMKISKLQEDFHNSPLIVSRLITNMDYESLQQLYRHYHGKYKEDPYFVLHLQMYVDGLVLSGTSASSLVLRDIVLETDCPKMLERILTTFHQYIRTPSEALAKEFDSLSQLLNKSTISKPTKSLLELSLANLISKTCERNLCTSTGLLDKYITYFEAKLSETSSFQEQTSGVLGLRNLRIGKSLDKLLEIATGDMPTNITIRVQAIWSLRPLLLRDSEETTQKMFKVFFDRTEKCEIRTSVFGLIMTTQPEERKLHEIAYYMWSETCPQTLNFVRSTLAVMAKSPSPCSKITSYAQTILKYMPPGSIDTTRTTAYALEYFDDDHGFGRSFFAMVQKSGKAALPVSIYFGPTWYIGGFASSPIGVFIRMQGLEKYTNQNIPGDDEVNLGKMVEILSSLNTTPRQRTPLRLELTVLYLDRVVYYYAADENSLQASILQGLQQMQNIQEQLTTTVQNSIIVGEVLYQQPLELGIPISIYTSGLSTSVLRSRAVGDMKPLKFSLDMDIRFQTNFFATTTISNHVPALGTIHVAGLSRTFSYDAPRHIVLNGEMDSGKLTFKVTPPSAENASNLQTHATGFTLLSNENPTATDHEDLLRKSCPTCSKRSLVSKGAGFAQSNQIISIPTYDGTQAGIRKFMCERQITKSQLLNKFRTFYGEGGKNTGLFGTTFAKLLLAEQQALDYFLFWPNPEPCGFTLFGGKNQNSSYALSEIEGVIQVSASSKEVSGTAKISFAYEGSSPPPTKVLTAGLKIPHEIKGSQKLQFRGFMTGGEETWVACADVENHATVPTTDFLGFEGTNEPQVNQTIKVKVGKDIKAETPGVGKSTPFAMGAECADDYLDLTIVGRAERSFEQKAEAAPGGSREWHYLFCGLERYTGKWPTSYIPPTSDCYKVVLDQTNLRNLNFTVNYKVAKELQKRWARPLQFLGNLLSPYSVDPDQDKVHESKHADHQHSHNYNQTSQMIEGEIEIDMNLRKQNPVMNVHFIGSDSDSTEEQHFHDFDLDLLPNALQIKPAASRFPYFTQVFMKAGFVGTCGVTPEYVITFDSFKYAGKIPDCDTIIAADCTEKPSFVVTARSSNGKLSAVGVRLQEAYIELTENGIKSPEIDINYDENGRFRHQTLTFERTEIDFSVKSMEIGIDVKYSKGGEFVKVILMSKYRGISCGLCGNFDTTSTNDLQGPNASVSNCPLDSMIDAWTIKDGSCKATPNQC